MKIFLFIAAFILIILGGFYYFFLSSPQSGAAPERFVISLNEARADTIRNLVQQGFARSYFGMGIALWFEGKLGHLAPGGYKISKSENVFGIAVTLISEPYMKWVVVPEGLRKEEIANLLQTALDWTDQTKADFLDAYTTSSLGTDYKEGVYFPDTYLLPKDETGLQIAQRFITHFNEKFSPYADGFTKQNIKWTTALKIASLIEREAGKDSDMPLIAGIIWNRLLKGMSLQIDATIQYVRGDTGSGYWAPLSAGDMKLVSPYNTYLHKGLPPTPIANAGLPAILAVLNPAQTNCLYYLHDSSGTIHCAATYAEHKANIQKYLK